MVNNMGRAFFFKNRTPFVSFQINRYKYNVDKKDLAIRCFLDNAKTKCSSTTEEQMKATAYVIIVGNLYISRNNHA